jgi:hypothetical protein
MNEVNPLVWPSPLGLGVMAPEEWRHTVSVLMASWCDPCPAERRGISDPT